MKLTRPKLTETLRRLADGKTVYQARKIAGISSVENARHHYRKPACIISILESF